MRRSTLRCRVSWGAAANASEALGSALDSVRAAPLTAKAWVLDRSGVDHRLVPAGAQPTSRRAVSDAAAHPVVDSHVTGRDVVPVAQPGARRAGQRQLRATFHSLANAA